MQHTQLASFLFSFSSSRPLKFYSQVVTRCSSISLGITYMAKKVVWRFHNLLISDLVVSASRNTVSFALFAAYESLSPLEHFYCSLFFSL